MLNSEDLSFDNSDFSALVSSRSITLFLVPTELKDNIEPVSYANCSNLDTPSGDSDLPSAVDLIIFFSRPVVCPSPPSLRSSSRPLKSLGTCWIAKTFLFSANPMQVYFIATDTLATYSEAMSLEHRAF